MFVSKGQLSSWKTIQHILSHVPPGLSWLLNQLLHFAGSWTLLNFSFNGETNFSAMNQIPVQLSASLAAVSGRLLKYCSSVAASLEVSPLADNLRNHLG